MAGHEDTAGILGIEGGGTKTTWAVLTRAGKVLARGAAGPGNTLLLSDSQLVMLFRIICHDAAGQVEAVVGAFAGCQLPAEKARVKKILRRVWPQARTVRALEDTRSVLAAAFGDGPGIVVIAGTGSNVAGQKSAHEPVEKAGGWGHLFADRGSAYDLARRGMEQVFARYDEGKKISPLAKEYLTAAGKTSLEELVPFLLQDMSKTAVAQWARCVFSAAQKGDREARALLDEAAAALAEKVVFIARRLRLSRPRVALTGGLFDNQPGYAASFQRALRRVLPKAESFVLTVPGVFGAARLAGLEKLPDTSEGSRRTPCDGPPLGQRRLPTDPAHGVHGLPTEPARLAAFASASTEQRNPRSRGLDKRSISALVDLFIREERYVEKALAAQRIPITRAATLVAKKLSTGGRLFYVGAGTSGRLGVVDASEMPPTFNALPEQVQAIIAGGAAAVFCSQEGAEDARDTGVNELKARGLTKRDVVCGIAASGQTPFVLAALDYARDLGAGTILLTCNPKRSIRVPVEVEIDLPTGPEIVTGSTRLKAGTATKLVLNMLSTIAMVRLGRVRDNLMINVQATNEKLRARAVRLVRALSACSAAEAQTALEKKGWRVDEAVGFLKKSRNKKA
jgi:N-acetylmuramic acid 6-phosphate etherase